MDPLPHETRESYQRRLDVERQRRQSRLPIRLGVNSGQVELLEINVDGGGYGGTARFLVKLQIMGPSGYMGQVHLTDELAGALVDILNRYLERPQPPVTVVVQLQERPRARRRHERVDQVAGEEREKEEIKWTMRGGR